MKHTLMFFTYILITIFPSYCMENMQQETILQNVTVIQKPIKAQYVTNDRVVIMGANGCSIINPSTNQEIIKINNEQNQSCFDLSLDKKEVALSRGNTIKIYNTETGEQMWMKKEQYDMNRIAFSPQKNILFSVENQYCKLKEHNYITDQTIDKPLSCPIWPNITFHPTQNILCTGTKITTLLYDLDNMPIRRVQKNLNFLRVRNYEYSHDGSFIIAHGFDETCKLDEIRIMDTQLNHLFSFFAHNNDHKFLKTKLNEDSTLLAVLAKQEGIYMIKYYDLSTKKCMYSAQIQNKNNIDSFTDLSFSPDETKLMITLNGECFITLTPFGIKQGAFIHWILKNYQTNGYEIPAEIAQHIVNNYIEIL